MSGDISMIALKWEIKRSCNRDGTAVSVWDLQDCHRVGESIGPQDHWSQKNFSVPRKYFPRKKKRIQIKEEIQTKNSNQQEECYLYCRYDLRNAIISVLRVYCSITFMGHLIFKIFWGSMDPPDRGPYNRTPFWHLYLKLVLCYIPKSIIKILSALNYFCSIKIQHDIQFDNLFVSHSYSVRVSMQISNM